MAVYAIGDIQGCYAELMNLLELIHFDPANDQVWFTGDLVNRGPASLQVLRAVRALGDSAITVLGNHDLHLLAVAEGHAPLHKGDTLDAILTAPDRDELLAWLRQQPLMHHDPALHTTLVHAGLPPQWDLAMAQACAKEVETVLRSDDYARFFQHMYGNQPEVWRDDLAGWDRLRFITNSFTRLRYCDATGHFDFKAKGEPGTQPEGYLPWFEIPGRRNENLRIVFGHWSTLGLRRERNIVSLDTGCLWGKQLTAVRLNRNATVFCVECSQHRHPGSGTSTMETTAR
ncbi:MAG TPA: symmetrical bis(5'-nucleosyl)-tetraphosphatase [Gammaproteobacteria bacterium]|nr:symmetrical bis(5'-nucleosyl)-tetraphosphatase [Gammaproteobacteria bacterium]